MAKRILITGGAGFLGSHVAGLLLARGDSVVVLDDFSNGKESHLEAFRHDTNLEIVRGDITNPSEIEEALSNCDVLMHLAVLCLRESIKSPQRVAEVIVNGTINCLEAALKQKVRLFLNCSSSEVYGSASYVPMDEGHPLHPETPYAAAKAAQDMFVRSYGVTYGLPYVTVRPFNMYGPNSHWQGHRGELIPKFIVRAMNGQPLVMFGDGHQTRDFLYVEEAAQAIVRVADSERCRATSINLCTGRETSIDEIGRAVCRAFDLDPGRSIRRDPPRPGDVARHLGDNSKLKDYVGFEPKVTIETGIPRTVEWFKAFAAK